MIMTKSADEEGDKNAIVLYILPKLPRGLDFPFCRDYDKRNVPVHIEIKEGNNAVYRCRFRNIGGQITFNGR